jgi:hypothetical protein
MPTAREAADQKIWDIGTSVCCSATSRWSGIQTATVLRRVDKNSLIVDTVYKLPSLTWRILMAAAVVVLLLLAIVLKGQPASSVCAEGAAAVFVVYQGMLWLHQRGMKFDLQEAVADIVIDEQRGRIAMLAEAAGKKRWIILSNFRGRFPEVSAVIHDILGSKCRAGRVA